MEKTEKEKALEIAALMEDGKGQDYSICISGTGDYEIPGTNLTWIFVQLTVTVNTILL